MTKPGIKQVEVQIMGQSYLLACPHDGEPALMEAVQKVDGAMCRIRDAGKVKARDRIAVLASLNIAFELSQKDTSGFKNSSFGNAEPSPHEDASPSVAAADEARLKQLLARLDKALDKDGQLI
jgi:cell division protein ZapA